MKKEHFSVEEAGDPERMQERGDAENGARGRYWRF